MAAPPPVIPNAEEITVVIPAAGSVPDGLIGLSNISCPAMIPVGGRPVVHWTLGYLRSLGLRRFIIAVSRRGMFIEDFVECVFGHDCQIEFMVPSHSSGVGRTVLDLAESVKTRAALVVLGDTSFQFADPGVLASTKPFVLVGPVDESYRWCVARIDSKSQVVELIDKKEDGVATPLLALIGVYYFPDVRSLVSNARPAVAEAESAGRPSQLAPILERVRGQTPILAVAVGDWLDCGNPDSQASSHRLLLQKRAFNELSIDPILGTITKRSQNVEKFIDEINYLRLLPPQLAVLFPRLLDYSVEWAAPFMTLEYYGYPTLADVFVFESVDPGIWERIFAHLRSILADSFMRIRRPLSSASVWEMYVEKTQRRLETLQAEAPLAALIRMETPITINDRPVTNLPGLWPQISAAVQRIGQTGIGCVIHGDLCFSNVLYDLRSRVVKLVDPRGSFGTSGIHGDPRYDVAKLYHSVRGLYDFIVQDLFHLSVNGSAVRLDVRARPRHRHIRERFEAVFFPEFNRNDITLITGLLFLSMPALHYDNPRRQTAMYLIGLLLVNEALSGEPAGVV